MLAATLASLASFTGALAALATHHVVAATLAGALASFAGGFAALAAHHVVAATLAFSATVLAAVVLAALTGSGYIGIG